MEEKNTFLSVVLVVIVIVMVVTGVALVKSVDLLRFRAESISSEMKELQNKIGNVEKQLNDIQMHGGVAAGKTDLDQSAAEPIANKKFYDPKAVNGGRIIIATGADTKNMNSLVNNEFLVSTIWGYATDSLANRNFEHPEKFEPKLAESWSLSEDKLTYTIKLRKGILWHDFTDPVSGKKWENVEVKAEDFKFYVDAVKNPDTDCAPIRSYLLDLDSIEVVSDYEFKVIWKKPYFLSESVTLELNPLPRHLYHSYDGPFDGKRFNDDHERNRMIVGCGPYRFEKWEKDQRVVLKKFDKYFGRKYGINPPLEYVVFEIIKNPNTQFQTLLSKKVDRINLEPEQWVTRTNIPEFDEKTGFLKKFKYPGRSYSYIGYNMKMPLFQDKLVRQALTHLVDRERILKEVFYGLGRITTGPFFMDTPYYDKSIKPYPFSVEKAKELLAKAGWKDTNNDGILDKDGKKFEFTIFSVAGRETQLRMLPIIKEDMAKAGVVMNIVSLEWSVYIQRLENKSFEACTLGWAMGFENDPYQLWHSAEADRVASSNHISFKNRTADRLIEEMRVCFDMEKRIQLCHEFHKLLNEEQPYTFLIAPYNLIAQYGQYRNVCVFPSGIETQIMWLPEDQQLLLPTSE